MLTDTEIILPEVNRFGLYTGVICVNFRDVIQVQFILTGVRVQHRRGRFFLENLMFPTRRVYDSVVALLVDSVAKSRERFPREG